MTGVRAAGVRIELPPRPPLSAVVATALAEDLEERGDVTARATVDEEVRVTGVVASREAGTVAGLAVLPAVFDAVDRGVEVRLLVGDGTEVVAGDVVAELSGPGRSILTGERTALNLVSHLSGIATVTRAHVAAVAGTAAVVRDTRKTLPGLRALQKAAVAAGGGVNHRMSLSDGLLVKDNHVAAAGGVAAATRAALSGAGGLSVQVEVDDLAELGEALAAGADSVLLDNFSPADLREAVQRCRTLDRRVFVEASGGVTLETIAAIARTGVDAIAVGALTHSVRALDLGLDLAPPTRGGAAGRGGA
jgi:nicotinate-nucleotide pyrophosphorylase (carboxylating)